jgi:hypothetical protein
MMKTKKLKRNPPEPLAELPVSERGPKDLKSFDLADGEPEPVERSPDFGMLDLIRPRQIKRGPFSEPILALEILDGPYRGITFAFTKFIMLPGRDEHGMTPTTYETEVFVIPDDLKGTFVKDEAFDEFTSGVVVAWLSYINTNSLAPLLRARPLGKYGVQ